jgi:hypothetical protein
MNVRFKRNRRALAQWALEIRPGVVVMEGTGVYWKSPFAALETVGTIAWVVNAIVALAHKMLRTIYAMLFNGTHCQDKSAGCEALSAAFALYGNPGHGSAHRVTSGSGSMPPTDISIWACCLPPHNLFHRSR